MHKTAVITGATKGLGRALSEVFAANGFDLWVCARTESDLEEMRTLWQERFPENRLHVFPADLSKKAELIEFGHFVLDTCPQVDVLINNAGLYLTGQLVDEPEGNLETMMETNLYSAYHLTRLLLPRLIEQKSGYVFNICSIASFLAYPNASAYTISKFAMLGFSRVLREEMKPLGIKVTAVMPGVFWSDTWTGSPVPPGRLMQPSDVATAVWGCYALSDASVVEELVLRPQMGDL